MNFWYDEGIAVSEHGEVYLFYYTMDSMQAYKVELPEKVDTEGHAFACIGDRLSEYGFAQVYVNRDDFYIIKTDEIKTMKMNDLDYLDEGFEALSQKPTYTIVKGEPKSFDRFETWFGGDSQEFGMNCYMEMDEYTYRYDMYLSDDVERHYLIQFIPEEELAQVWCKEYSSYGEVEEAIKELNEFLKNWEEQNLEWIIETYESDMDYWDNLYPEMLFEYYG